MGYRLSNEKFNKLLDGLKGEYKIYAPIRFPKRGRFSDTDLIRYGEINKVEDVVWIEKSNYSPKEIVFPITQTLFYFTEDEFKESMVHNKKILIFLRPCDINGMRRLDTIFLNNGPIKDVYYERLREKVKFVMMECKDGFENCFCVSTNSNYTQDYSIAVRFTSNEVFCELKDESFQQFFSNLGTEMNFKPEYIEENSVKVQLPEVDKITTEFFNHDMWKEYSKRCIGCGRCNMACITCSCFTNSDIAYEENPNAGERRRVWAGCHIDKFTDMAGGHSFRQDYSSRMRFKTMHKIYDYKKRFGEHMCVGCGRCDDICPEYISFSNCINKVSKTLKEDESNAQ
ncbi:MAG: anaerobic sulfite reductase subunit AsrA [Clostridia bacterium]|nr:anaerobic sulfite reductase subunit AsrA [Clostridia bacterium]